MEIECNKLRRSLRLTVICHNTPYPPNHGGKLDMWNSLKMLHEEGVELQIISWHDQDYTESQASQIKAISTSDHLLKLSRKPLFRLSHLPLLLLYPWFSCIRWPMDGSLKNIIESISNFQPNAILLHGWHGALLAFYIKKKFNLPLLYRSHNVEYLYIKNQYQYINGTKKKLINLVSQWHMRGFEIKILEGSEMTYAISDHDNNFFKNNGHLKVKTILPFMQIKRLSAQREPCYDILFIGNLHTKNNISGIKWLIEEVMPIVSTNRPRTSLAIAGSEPEDSFLKYLLSQKNIELLIDQKNSEEVLSKGRIYVNPVESAGGIQLKNIEMAMFNRPIVARAQSVSGLPNEMLDLFDLATSAEEFANAILRNLSVANKSRDNFEKLNFYFGKSQARIIIEDLAQINQRAAK